MTSIFPVRSELSQTEVFYPSSDGEPLAETSVHVDAIINAIVTLRQYLADQPAIVLADQFLYYAEGFPKLRVAPDIMVIFNVPPGPRDSYRTWEEKAVPSVIFEITSASMREQDETVKKTLYEQMEVAEYWQFDPKGEWIAAQLRGYRLQDDRYQPIETQSSQVLGLRLQVNGGLIDFYRQDTGEKLLAPDQLIAALQQEIQWRRSAEAQLAGERQRAEQEHLRAEQERQRAEQAEAEIQRLRQQLRDLGA